MFLTHIRSLIKYIKLRKLAKRVRFNAYRHYYTKNFYINIFEQFFSVYALSGLNKNEM